MKIPPDPTSVSPGAATPRTEKPAVADSTEKLKEACREFEALFLHTLLKGMRATLPGDALGEEGFGVDVYADLRDLHVARAMARQQGVGIAEALFRQLQPAAKEAPVTDSPTDES